MQRTCATMTSAGLSNHANYKEKSKMILKTKDKATAEAIRTAIEEVENIRVEDMRSLNAKGTRYRMKLSVHSSKARFGKRSTSAFRAGRRIHALCWHGFRDAFRAAFTVDPDAVFSTALAVWKGKEHFEANYMESGYKVCGAPIAPYTHCMACCCADGGAFED